MSDERMEPSPRRSWRRLLLAGAVVVLLLLLFAYLAKGTVQRALYAVGAYRAQIFTPPPSLAQRNFATRALHTACFYWDFAEIPIARAERLRLLNPDLKPPVAEITRRQAAGEDMLYSMHIYREIRWRLNFTSDVAVTRSLIEQLRQSLAQPEMQKLAHQQQASDGAWALGIDAWYLLLYYTVEDDSVPDNQTPKYPLSFLDRINSPEKLTAQLTADLHDDFTHTGVFNREETDETFSALARQLFGHSHLPYAFDPQLGDSLREFVNAWQNPATGFWGQWLVDRYGDVWKMDDSAMTFHVVSDLRGQVKRRGQIARRLMELDAVNFPAGIRFNGHYENHLNMDVVKILHTTWPDMDEATRERARQEIARMVQWCLTESLQPDGSFKISDLDDTTGDAFQYGVSFLREAGYFRKEDRFWTDQDFPDSNAVRARIEGKLQSVGLKDPGLRDAWEALEATKQEVKPPGT